MSGSTAKKIVLLIDGHLRDLSVKGAYESWAERLDTDTSNYDEFLFGMLVQAVFSGGMKGQIVDAAMPVLKNACFGWNINKVASLTESDLKEIANIPGAIGNMPKLRVMRDNAKKVLNLQESFGSFSNFLKSFSSVDQLADALSNNKSKFKFKYIANVTVYDFLRNTGFASIKPDRHVMRFFQRIGLLSEPATEQLTITTASQFASNAGIALPILDGLIYLFCGDRPDVVRFATCGAVPICEKCPIIDYCKHYQSKKGKRKGTGRQ